MKANNFKVFVIASGEEVYGFAGIPNFYKIPVGISAYSINPQLKLMKMQLPPDTRGRLLVVSDIAIDTDYEEFAAAISSSEISRSVGALASRICHECSLRGFTHIFFDFENKDMQESLALLLSQLTPLLLKSGYPTYISEMFAPRYDDFKGCRFVMQLPKNSNPSESISDMCSIMPPQKIILDIPRLCIRTSLPPSATSIENITPAELLSALSESGSQSFYSEDLCINYFTVNENSSTLYYVYDDSRSMLQKLSCAADAGLSGAFLLCCETEDILDKIFT